MKEFTEGFKIMYPNVVKQVERLKHTVDSQQARIFQYRRDISEYRETVEALRNSVSSLYETIEAKDTQDRRHKSIALVQGYGLSIFLVLYLLALLYLMWK